MKNTDNIEKLFKETFEHFEADVNPNLWTNVQGGINSGIGSTASTAAKFAAGKIIAGATAVAVVAGSVWYFASTHDNKINSTTPSAQHKTEAVVNENPENSISENKSEEPVSPASYNKQTISPADHSAKKSENTSQQPQVVSDASSNNSTATDNSSSDNPTSSTEHKYGTASQDDGGMMRYNKHQDDPAASSADNVLSDENTADESSSDATAESDIDQARSAETKMPSDIYEVPNIFTPNGDGNNDVFFFKMKNITSIGVAILNQRGELVAKWNSLEGNWNGKTFSGSDAAEGVYIYSIHGMGADGLPISKSGTLTLER